ncbi:phage tail tape measure protein [Edwardsiella anguillarum]|uniref:phage tail tape measure protein n=1 Tax=Edwardsiella anguillarum TaxID=1821960 RepID=UPI0024B6F471|nr:phage tail tape measure protein [Edwardsiella anguillarum]WHQ13396.1 phage tail tape measure protein [Edwardsiella anguillarum]
MSTQNLRLQVLLNAVDKMTRPLRSVSQQSSETARVLKAAQQQVKDLNRQTGQIDGHRKLARDVAVTGNKLKSAQDRVRALATAMQNSTAPTAAMRREFERAQQEAQRLKERYGQLTQTQQRSRTALRNTGIDTRNLSQHQSELRQKLENANRSVEEQRRRLERLNRQQQRMNSAKASYAGTMQTRNKLAGFGATATATGVGMLYGGARVMMPGYDFDVGMSRVQALTRTDKNSAELKRLRKQSRELGASTSFTANDVAQGQGFLAMAGYTPDNIEQAMPHMLELSKAAGMDSQLAEVADIASNIQSAYKIPADQMQRMADALTFTFTTSNTDLRMLGETMKYVGPAAQAAGQDFETMSAMAGMLGNVGVQGSQAGTSLRMALVRLAKQPKAASEALDSLGVSVADSAGRMKPMPQLLSEISASFKKLGIDGAGNAQKLAYISKIFGTESTSALAELLDKQASLDPSLRIEAYAEQVKGALGTAGTVAKTMADNMKGDMQGLQSAWEDLGIEMFESVDSPLRSITQRITGILRAIGSWMKANPQLTATLVKIAATIGAFAVALGTVSLALATILGPIALLKLSLSVLGIKGGSALGLLMNAVKGVGNAVIWLSRVMLANPILAMIALIAGAAIWLWQNWDWLGPKFAALWNGLKQMCSDAWNSITAATHTAWEGMKSFLSGVWDGIKTIVNTALNTIISFFTHWNLSTVFTTVWDSVINSCSNLPARFTKIGGNIMEGLKQGIFAKWESVKQGVLDLGSSISNWFKDKLGIHSPSRVFAEMGRYTVDGLAIGIEGNTQAALASIGYLSKRLVAAGAGLTLSAAAVAMPPISALPDNRTPLSPSSVAAPAASSRPITIHIHAAPGMNEQQLAKLVVQELDRRERQNAARNRSSLRDID